MRDAAGRGDVTNRQIDRQIAVLNRDFSGTGYRFNLVSTHRYNNTAWHRDSQSARYRALTRKGGANALNIWLVDFQFLGIATFPWDYARKGEIDGIRVHYDSLPGGSIANFNLGGTATHEAGHWFGLYHTFQGGCTELNDEVDDTPAQMQPHQRLPRGPGLLPDARHRPDPQLHGLQLRQLLHASSPGARTSAPDKMWAAYRA